MKYSIKIFKISTHLILIVVAALFVLLLTVVLVYFSDYLDPLIKARTNIIDFIYKLISISLICVTAIFSYFKFFKGRTFAPRVELVLEATVHEATASNNIHCVTLTLKNVGSVSIWEPKATLSFRPYGSEGAKPSRKISGWWNLKNHENTSNFAHIIECGESVSYTCVEYISNSIILVVYLAEITCKTKDVWDICKAVSNKV